jgi:hypothetical protein
MTNSCCPRFAELKSHLMYSQRGLEFNENNKFSNMMREGHERTVFIYIAIYFKYHPNSNLFNFFPLTLLICTVIDGTSLEYPKTP